MLRLSFSAGLCLALLGSAVAQDGAAAPPAASQDKSAGGLAYEQLVARFDEAVERYRKASEELRATDAYKTAYAKARETRDYTAVREITSKLVRVDYGAWAARFAAAAKAHNGDPAEIDFLLWGLRSSDKAVVGPIVQRLLDRFIRSPKLIQLAKAHYSLRRSLGQEEAQRVLSHLIAESPDKLVQANALYMRAYPVVMGRGGQAPTDEQRDQAKADMARILQIAPNSSVAMKVQAPEFERTRLQLGMVAPDILGEDLGGVAFKLSDYRGKVVVLDFWGDW